MSSCPDPEPAPLRFAATRDEAIADWRAFAPGLRRYAGTRNQVLPGHGNVSRLSPAIRRRLLLEGELIEETLRDFPLPSIEKWVQEVCWRGYWKGWLERRPELWERYVRDVTELPELLPPAVRDRMAAVAAGTSGVGVMDHFACELVETGYLHNHARMWFAGFWIHVERLPWQLGADFFFRHLLDADPASNTLSWRWVAGLQTPGKTYLPRRGNLEKSLAPELLAEVGTAGLDRLEPDAIRPAPPPPEAALREIEPIPGEQQTPPEPWGLWIHPDDASPERGLLPETGAPTAILVTAHEPYPGTSQARQAHLRTVMQDAAGRAAARWPGARLTTAPGSDRLAAWASGHGLRAIVTARPAPGPLRPLATAIRLALSADQIALIERVRPWDERNNRLARRGFFAFWKKLRAELATGDRALPF